MAVAVAVANQKGGVGKTTTVANLAHALYMAGLRVLAIDADPQASLTIYMGQDPKRLDEQGLTVWSLLVDGCPLSELVVPGPPDLLAASIRLASAEAELVREWNGATLLCDRLRSAASTYDLILLDCSPSLGLLTVNALAAADHVLVPVKTDYLSLMGMSLLLDTVERVRTRLNPGLQILGVLPTLFDARNGHDREVLDELSRELAGRCRLFAPVRRATAFDRAAVAASPIMVDDPQHRALAGYREVAQEISRLAHEAAASAAP
jgi:chromosome partitioning protein